MTCVAVVGYGYWGRILCRKIESVACVEKVKKEDYAFFLQSKRHYDMIVVATRHDSHVNIVRDITQYRKCKSELVFCEKPFSKDMADMQLLRTGDVYVSDIYLHNANYKELHAWCRQTSLHSLTFTTSNGSASQKDHVLFDLAYHDLYMAMDLTQCFDISCVRILNVSKHALRLTLRLGQCRIELSYDRSSTTKDKHIRANASHTCCLNHDPTKPDTIESMFASILRQEYDLAYNNKVAISSVDAITKIMENMKMS